jgi:hypothetical protein
MKNHITSVFEFQETGIFLKGLGRHTVRVMGALKVVHPPNLPVSKEELSVLVDRAPFEQYYAGEKPKTPGDQIVHPDKPQVPALYVTREGKVVFLGRNLEEIA